MIRFVAVLAAYGNHDSFVVVFVRGEVSVLGTGLQRCFSVQRSVVVKTCKSANPKFTPKFIFIDCPPVVSSVKMFQLMFDLGEYATTYRATRDAYLKAANELKLATGPYKAARDAYVAGTATYTKSLYE